MYQRSQVSRAALEAKFAPHFGKHEFMAIQGKQATLTAGPTAPVMDRGWPVFEVSGTQPTTAAPINFKIKFAYDGNWDLAELTVDPVK